MASAAWMSECDNDHCPDPACSVSRETQSTVSVAGPCGDCLNGKDVPPGDYCDTCGRVGREPAPPPLDPDRVVGYLFRCRECGRSRELHSMQPAAGDLTCGSVTESTTDFPDGGFVRQIVYKPHKPMLLIKPITAIDINPFAKELA